LKLTTLTSLDLDRFLYLNIRVIVGEIVFGAFNFLAAAVVVIGNFILFAVNVVVVAYAVTSVTFICVASGTIVV